MTKIITVHGTFANPAEVEHQERHWLRRWYDRVFRRNEQLRDTEAIHSSGDQWWQLGSDFQRELEDLVDAPDGTLEFEPFFWSGANSELARREAGNKLLRKLSKEEQSDEPYAVIGHSHGASVTGHALHAAYAKKRELSNLKSWMSVAAPFVHFKRRGTWLARYNIWGKLVLLTVVSAISSIAIALFVEGYFDAIEFFGLAIPAAIGGAILRGYSARSRKRHKTQDRRQFKETFYRNWTALWHRDDEVISGLKAARKVDVKLIPYELLRSVLLTFVMLSAPVGVTAAVILAENQKTENEEADGGTPPVDQARDDQPQRTEIVSNADAPGMGDVIEMVWQSLLERLTYSRVTVPTGGHIVDFSFSDDNRQLLTVHFDGSIWLWSTETGAFQRLIRGPITTDSDVLKRDFKGALKPEGLGDKEIKISADGQWLGYKTSNGDRTIENPFNGEQIRFSKEAFERLDASYYSQNGDFSVWIEDGNSFWFRDKDRRVEIFRGDTALNAEDDFTISADDFRNTRRFHISDDGRWLLQHMENNPGTIEVILRNLETDDIKTILERASSASTPEESISEFTFFQLMTENRVTGRASFGPVNFALDDGAGQISLCTRNWVTEGEPAIFYWDVEKNSEVKKQPPSTDDALSVCGKALAYHQRNFDIRIADLDGEVSNPFGPNVRTVVVNSTSQYRENRFRGYAAQRDIIADRIKNFRLCNGLGNSDDGCEKYTADYPISREKRSFSVIDLLLFHNAFGAALGDDLYYDIPYLHDEIPLIEGLEGGILEGFYEWISDTLDSSLSFLLPMFFAISISLAIFVLVNFLLVKRVVDLVNNWLSGQLKNIAWGNDAYGESVIFVSEEVFGDGSRSWNYLPAPVSSAVSDHTRQFAEKTLEKMRQAVGAGLQKSSSVDVRRVLADQMTWKELIHTGYFDVSEFTKFVAAALCLQGVVRPSPLFRQGGEFDDYAKLVASVSPPGWDGRKSDYLPDPAEGLQKPVRVRPPDEPKDDARDPKPDPQEATEEQSKPEDAAVPEEEASTDDAEADDDGAADKPRVKVIVKKRR